ncbi:photosystem I reaction center subunit N, chloroplastic-like [Olea europaea subsp. europaea]|uniref:Photosystem I reaction center subunit N, chloroplastic n=3 Tax=Olea europaea subsp. europaea TaxID=158383 RepID=A0A8S0QTQ5_OLEEU|nr:photosystem I reaction center subunit N, chloroplastic-like [Olea europaea subsp. europaea]
MGVRQSHLIHTPTTTLITHSTFITTPINQNFHYQILHNTQPLLHQITANKPPQMAAMNSSVLACNYVMSGTELSSKVVSMPSVATPIAPVQKLPVIRAQQVKISDSNESGRRAAVLCLGAALLSAAVSTSSASAGIIEEYIEKSKTNKELNDKKRLATSGANFARAFTVQFGTCKFPENFTGCQDLAKQKKVPFISEDLELECKGKDKYKCGSNVFWKWKSLLVVI